MEKISQTKHKGGRPRLFPNERIGLMGLVNGDIRTDRTVNNRHYTNIAFKIFEDIDSDEYNHLFNKKKEIVKTTILSELGRVVDMYSNGKEMMLAIAKIICDDKMNTAKAINFIKRYRMQVNKNKISGTLKKIVTIINNANFDEADKQYFFVVLKALAEENLPAEEDLEEDLEEE
jgi:hypothetical protein